MYKGGESPRFVVGLPGLVSRSRLYPYQTATLIRMKTFFQTLLTAGLLAGTVATAHVEAAELRVIEPAKIAAFLETYAANIEAASRDRTVAQDPRLIEPPSRKAWHDR